MTDEQKPKNRARKRAIIARMAQAGEPFSVAARHVDAEHARKTAEPSAAESQRKQKHPLDDQSASHEPAADANAPLTPGAFSLTSKEKTAPAAMPPNPAELARRPRGSEDALRPRVGVGRPGPVALTARQARAMLRAAETESPHTHALISLLLVGGLALSKTLIARAEDLGIGREADPFLTVKGRGGRKRRVLLLPELMRVLEVQLDGRTEGFILPNRTGGQSRPDEALRTVRRVAAEAGIEAADKISSRSLRRAAVALHFVRGIDLPPHVLMGHVNLLMAPGYSHRSRGTDGNVGEEVEALRERLVQPEQVTNWRCRFEPGDYECRMAMNCDCRRER
ncbi:tyrosine-type recombinase/integrase [Streptomyces sp. NPDC014684]|uniref:tyrosine-type recombinase/integrase n=1 Tax=Streptomyces sp. NPDC014684 TaxID=3364880 RepID=UPI0036FEC122